MKIYKAWFESAHKVIYVTGYFENKDDAWNSIKDFNNSASDGDKDVDEIEIIPKANQQEG